MPTPTKCHACSGTTEDHDLVCEARQSEVRAAMAANADALAYAEAPRFLVIESTPGYMPESEGEVFGNIGEAYAHAADLLEEIAEQRAEGERQGESDTGALEEIESDLNSDLGLCGIMRHNSHELDPNGQSFYVEDGTALPRVIEVRPFVSEQGA